jgi:hypothetical protein
LVVVVKQLKHRNFFRLEHGLDQPVWKPFIYLQLVVEVVEEAPPPMVMAAVEAVEAVEAVLRYQK